jgi:hypothetical protein
MRAHSWVGSASPRTAGDQPRDGQQDEGNGKAGRRRQVPGPPLRIELGLEVVEAFEIVELPAQIEDGRADFVPARCKTVALQPGKRRDTEIEPLIALIAAPQHEFGKQQVHDAARTGRVVTHQVDRHLFLALERPQVRESHDVSVRRPDHSDRHPRDIGLVEVTQ